MVSVNEDYNNVLDNMQVLYGMDSSENFFYILSVLSSLMIEVGDHRLKGAKYINEFKHERMKVRIIVEKE